MSTKENHDNLTVGEGMMQNATHRRHDWTNLGPTASVFTTEDAFPTAGCAVCSGGVEGI